MGWKCGDIQFGTFPIVTDVETNAFEIDNRVMMFAVEGKNCDRENSLKTKAAQEATIGKTGFHDREQLIRAHKDFRGTEMDRGQRTLLLNGLFVAL